MRVWVKSKSKAVLGKWHVLLNTTEWNPGLARLACSSRCCRYLTIAKLAQQTETPPVSEQCPTCRTYAQ